jgi:hypothetical protein
VSQLKRDFGTAVVWVWLVAIAAAAASKLLF